jgi:hypothetical protein
MELVTPPARARGFAKMHIVIGSGRRCAAAALAAAFGAWLPAAAQAQSPPVRSAPSQYVEVLPSGAGSPEGPGSRPAAPPGELEPGPGSALEAAAGAASHGDGHLALLAAAMLLTTGCLVTWSVVSRRRP